MNEENGEAEGRGAWSGLGGDGPTLWFEVLYIHILLHASYTVLSAGDG